MCEPPECVSPTQGRVQACHPLPGSVPGSWASYSAEKGLWKTEPCTPGQWGALVLCKGLLAIPQCRIWGGGDASGTGQPDWYLIIR